MLRARARLYTCDVFGGNFAQKKTILNRGHLRVRLQTFEAFSEYN